MTIDRRRFLTRSAAVLGTGGLAAGGGYELAADRADAAPAAPRSTLDNRVAFDGEHQSGVVTRGGGEATFAALDAIAPDRAGLIQGLQALSSRARQLATGTTLPRQEPDEPPSDSGTLGPTIAPDALTVTIALGATLFDDRYGLAKVRPRRLRPMPAFPDDDLDPARTHGDLLLQVTANHRDTVVHALRELLRPVRGAFALRWSIDGFQSADRGPTPASSRRNLFGFRDGTANPDVDDDALMRRLVWVQRGGGRSCSPARAGRRGPRTRRACGSCARPGRCRRSPRRARRRPRPPTRGGA